MKQEDIEEIYLGRNRNKKRVNVYFYEAMLPVMRKIAQEKYGKPSASLFAFMTCHKELLRYNRDFRKMLNKQ